MRAAASTIPPVYIPGMRVYVYAVNPVGACMTVDRRHSTRRYRVPASGPVTVSHDGQYVPATLRDVSLGGVFFFTDAPIRAGAEIRMVLMLPREVGLRDDKMVCCEGKIVRVEEHPGKFGIAAEFERMEGVPQL